MSFAFKFSYAWACSHLINIVYINGCTSVHNQRVYQKMCMFQDLPARLKYTSCSVEMFLRVADRAKRQYYDVTEEMEHLLITMGLDVLEIKSQLKETNSSK